ncbi:YraN family protein [Streptomyces decoyicus]|nr:YraN family protein [Streptomyces decoyicus]
MNAMQAGRRAGDDAQTAGRARQTRSGAPPTGRKPPTDGRAAVKPEAAGPPAVRRPPAGPLAVKQPPAGPPAVKQAPAGSPAAAPTVASPPGTDPAAAKPADTRRRALGRYGEDLAARRLIEAGMRILDRNWRCRDGEIDIVAADGDALVVCEVKTRRAGWYEHPMAAVRPEKTARLRLLAERWLERHGGPPPGGVRIDVIGVLLPARGAPVVQHARGVA